MGTKSGAQNKDWRQSPRAMTKVVAGRQSPGERVGSQRRKVREQTEMQEARNECNSRDIKTSKGNTEKKINNIILGKECLLV